MEIGLSPLGEYFIFINNPKRQALRFWVCELLCQSACLCCASAPVLRVAKRRYHEPLGRYAMPRFTVIIVEHSRVLFCPRSAPSQSALSRPIAVGSHSLLVLGPKRRAQA